MNATLQDAPRPLRPHYTPADFSGDHARRRDHGNRREEAEEGQEVGQTRPIVNAATTNKHELYQASVQNVEAEIDFVDQTFRTLRGRDAVRLREDFCGTGNTSCEWVRRRIVEPRGRARHRHRDARVGPGAHGREERSSPSSVSGSCLLERNVIKPGRRGRRWTRPRDELLLLAVHDRGELVSISAVRESLGEGGLFFQDFYGGSESMEEREDERTCELPNGGRFTYIWDQHRFKPVTGEVECRIHFKFRDGSKMQNAFVYHWRLWTLPEIQELLAEAGFSRTTVYWEGDELDDDGEPTGEGNGVFTPEAEGDADPAFICYIVSEK
jgi:hypothetical protein